MHMQGFGWSANAVSMWQPTFLPCLAASSPCKSRAPTRTGNVSAGGFCAFSRHFGSRCYGASSYYPYLLAKLCAARCWQRCGARPLHAEICEGGQSLG
ncbi:unnamed protein product [Symbiodinium pilosum]|uniref:Uncharacterized protein n=1 Tax=Symbiodinium pilosum TaxID=2952 RepID=A0A812K571_SYMPI|nr:unnamed protein product [Symbiodinium pilosum]